MVTMSDPNRSLCPTLKVWKWGHLFFLQKETRAKRVSMTTTLWVLFGFFCDEQFGCHVRRTLLLFFQRYSLFSILLFLQTSWRHHLPNLHNTKTLMSLKRKKIFQKGKRHSYFFENYFSFHKHLKFHEIT